ncbi:MAG: hypothetical protein ABI675_19535 [Chitinophagaceae bacterium]
MEYKKEIETLLITLKSKGYSRAYIEKKLDYSENYIDQILSKGGNKKVAGALKRLNESLLQNATSRKQEAKSITLNEDEAEYDKKNQPLAMQALADLAVSNREMAEAHNKLATSQVDLVSMLKQKTTVSDSPKIDVNLEKRFSDILMILAQVGTGKRWATIAEANEELNKLLIDHP